LTVAVALIGGLLYCFRHYQSSEKRVHGFDTENPYNFITGFHLRGTASIQYTFNFLNFETSKPSKQ
jgi:hypothetical protein